MLRRVCHPALGGVGWRSCICLRGHRPLLPEPEAALKGLPQEASRLALQALASTCWSWEAGSRGPSRGPRRAVGSSGCGQPRLARKGPGLRVSLTPKPSVAPEATVLRQRDAVHVQPGQRCWGLSQFQARPARRRRLLCARGSQDPEGMSRPGSFLPWGGACCPPGAQEPHRGPLGDRHLYGSSSHWPDQ